MKKQTVLVAIGSLFLAACSNGFEAAQLDLNSAVNANSAAVSYDQWHDSESHPEHLLIKWRSQIASEQMTSADVCKAFDEMDVQHLTLFENELADEANKDVVGECAEELLAKIERFYINDRAALTANLGNFFEHDVKTFESKGNVKIQGVGSAKTSDFTFQPITKSIDTTVGYHVDPNRKDKVTNKYKVVDAKQVVLTFDDGPRLNTEIVLKILDEVGAKALFFQVGEKAIEVDKANKINYSNIAKKVAAAGHVFGGHSETHANLRAMSNESARKEIYKGLNDVIRAVGWAYPIFRFPYGNSTPALINDLTKMGIASFYWHVDSEDWKSKRSTSELIDYTMGQVRAKSGGVILFHDIHKRTAQMLPQFLRTLHNEGYQIVLLKPTKVIKSPIDYNPVPPKP